MVDLNPDTKFQILAIQDISFTKQTQKKREFVAKWSKSSSNGINLPTG